MESDLNKPMASDPKQNKDAWITWSINRDNKKKFRVSDCPITYRQINVLDKDGLIPNSQEDDRSWRKFNLKEIVYLDVIKELKDYGLENKQLKEVRNCFYDKKTEGRGMSESDVVMQMAWRGEKVYMKVNQ